MTAPRTPQDQQEVIAFLSDPASYTPAPERVERMETHCAYIFLAGTQAWKIKRAVRLSYLDFSTLQQRRAACEREVEINRITAPDLYLGVVPICRAADGSLSFGGPGEAVEWAVHMKRFDQEALLDSMARRGALPLSLMVPLADHIAAYHARAPVRRSRDGRATAALEAVVDSVAQALSNAPDYGSALKRAFAAARALLEEREQAGHVRRCHGDLHLRNIVVLNGKPVLFDAIEFDEQIATIDVLYDLAFLLMDLWHRAKRRHANLVLNRYLWREGSEETLAGLRLMPLFLSLRAGVRAMVASDRLAQLSGRARAPLRDEMESYLASARRFLQPAAPRLVGVGGLSGTGKSTLAAGLAPEIGAPPGAVHLRSDVERKLLFGKSPEAPLDAGAYTPEISRTVYARLYEKAAIALAAGRSVIVDAVFARPGERAALAQTARAASAPFTGLWLEADPALLKRRVAQRHGDASDAGPEVVEEQTGYDVGEIDWHRLDASGSQAQTHDAAMAVLEAEPKG